MIKFKLPKEVVTVKSSDKLPEDFLKVGFINEPSLYKILHYIMGL